MVRQSLSHKKTVIMGTVTRRLAGKLTLRQRNMKEQYCARMLGSAPRVRGWDTGLGSVRSWVVQQSGVGLGQPQRELRA